MLTDERYKILLKIARVITPKLAIEIKENHEYIQRTPRPFTLFLKEILAGDKPLIGCEIGFGLGQNALNLLDNLNIETLYCVDPSIGRAYQDLGGVVSCHVGKPNQYNRLIHDPRVVFIELRSDPASQYLSEQGLDFDFVYVDGLHTYEQCLADLKNYYPLLKKGGFIGGHDFTRACESGVIRAVLDFAVSVNQSPRVVMPDFWFKRA